MINKIKEKRNDLIFILQFTIDDFKMRYAGSLLGFLWAFLQPITTIFIYWFVFQGSQAVDDYPFILWLVAGLIPWFFISEAISNATPTMVQYSYLVKKVMFNINILPIVKELSVLIVQIVLILFTIIFFSVMGYYPDIQYLEILVYLFYMFIITTGISYLTATLYVFYRDIIQIVGIVLQLFFWFTPIVWNMSSHAEWIRKIVVFNPIYYIVNGYRNVFIYKQRTSENIGMLIYYWVFAFIILFIGIRIFNKCKNHFADTL